jgi:Restriction endonuclease AspBHI N-terminal/Restriction endonuclease
MTHEDPVQFVDLSTADLILDRTYRGGHSRNFGDDPISRLLPVGNQGGFRVAGSIVRGTVRLVVLYTSGVEVDWPDAIDPTTGDFTYYGDNRHPGRELHDTPRGGNLLLREVFAASRESADRRLTVPPVLLFQATGSGRDVVFRGLLAPGSPRLSGDEELVAIWRTTKDYRFQNYRSHFTVLRTSVVSRAWINQILAGDPLADACPGEWRKWVQGRIYQALEAPRNLAVRKKAEQLPKPEDAWMMRMVHKHFSSNPVAFENFAAELWVRSDPHVASVEVTRPSRDGGRDAIGEYRLGPGVDPVRLQFALEAKCYNPDGGGLGVKMVSRLISRIKHREFGVFVTTAYVGDQPYKEVREDGHPIVFLVGRDLVEILKKMGLSTPATLATYLNTEYPHESEPPVVDIVQEIVDPSMELATINDLLGQRDLGREHEASDGGSASFDEQQLPKWS